MKKSVLRSMSALHGRAAGSRLRDLSTRRQAPTRVLLSIFNKTVRRGYRPSHNPSSGFRVNIHNYFGRKHHATLQDIQL
jgi:hypothetical protein